MEYNNKFVDFSLCNSCVNKDKKEDEDPCHECLQNATNEHSIKPVKYEEKK